MSTPRPAPVSGRADANRRRILDVAVTELLRDPDASMDQIARAAGVVRRTVYGHFPSRDALVGAIVDRAIEAVETAHAKGREGAGNPAEAVAGSLLAVWEVADRYRLLLSLAQRSVTMGGIRERLGAVHASGVEIFRRGLDDGTFVSPLPPRALSYVLEGVLFAVMEAVNDGVLEAEEAGRSTAITFLTATGLPAPEATELVTRVARRGTPGDGAEGR
ncbi:MULTISPECIES: TetR/AcrR family transcriptional regulator [Streptomyces]|uniref:TetR/AcrR family transcriptional regulator n=1 Tax=Streptomyces TaxID=1883 RepID=UPI00099E2163|nr:MULTISPECIES: TetR/AcrR family transcriptional regulator [Streptomyces]